MKIAYCGICGSDVRSSNGPSNYRLSDPCHIASRILKRAYTLVRSLVWGNTALCVEYCLSGGTVLSDLMAGNVPSDPHAAVNRYTGARLPQIFGHEMSGTIVELGPNVEEFKVGQRVTVNAAIDDRHLGLDPCNFCSIGRHNICDRIHFYGVNIVLQHKLRDAYSSLTYGLSGQLSKRRLRRGDSA